MVGWHHRLSGHGFEQTLGDSEGYGSLQCCSPWDCKESDMTEQLNNNNGKSIQKFYFSSSPFIQQGKTGIRIQVLKSE